MVGITPDLSDDKNRDDNGMPVFATRGSEVRAWLAENEVGRFVILDDDGDFDGYESDCLVRTNPNFGLTMNEALLAIEILTSDSKARAAQ